MNATGVGGELLVSGHQYAARLGTWSLAPIDSGSEDYRVVVELTHTNAYWIDQRPIRLVLWLGDLSWSWDDVRFDQTANSSLTVIVSGEPRESMR